MARRSSRPAEEIDRLTSEALAGNRSALGRILSEIERGQDGAERIDRAISARAVQGYTIGITGAPGAGKSALLGGLLAHAVSAGERAAALMVDPSSPISNGALLGDRLRMQEIAADKAVFVRSMASRGRTGGLAHMTRRAARFLGACEWPWVFVETVGIGQVDVDVSTLADIVIVVLNPGAGDEVQVFKAGLMEVADVFVINKADHPLVNGLRQDLAGMIATIPAGRPKPRVVETVATTRQGIAELWLTLGEQLLDSEHSGELYRRRTERVGREILEIMNEVMARRLEQIHVSARFNELKAEVAAGKESLYSAALRLLGDS